MVERWWGNIWPKAYSKDGVHIVHFRLDCDLDVPLMREHYGDNFNLE